LLSATTARLPAGQNADTLRRAGGRSRRHQGGIGDVGHGTDRLNVLDTKAAASDQRRQPAAKPRLPPPGLCDQGLASLACGDVGCHQDGAWCHDAADLGQPGSQPPGAASDVQDPPGY